MYVLVEMGLNLRTDRDIMRVVDNDSLTKEMIMSIVKEVPTYVARHMKMSHVKEYQENVRKKFPIEGKEIEYGYIGPAYERNLSNEKVEVIGWDDFNYSVHIERKIGEGKFTDYWTQPIWFYTKEEITIDKALNGVYAKQNVEGIIFEVWGKDNIDAIANLKAEIRFVTTNTIYSLLASYNYGTSGDDVNISMPKHVFVYIQQKMLENEI